ncbi:monovalent cation/H(+) antiporter subunit G [Thermococcus waiotapuensis]|uniref:Monovalent cation/H(+) antiporter subunit G n=1 Tax=Thermococcus waiotapuensis TaxID=90909 RepID=A0AAE4NW14_9EURY|nr:monovalent cation/H(+) antiporter subunit G [Thermococcus waiotapuensis]MDV3103878.1 monovalent cation/H(+) antiporter subunit G [Thermococcus waiotapuensis]
MIEEIIFIIGSIAILLGAIYDLIAAIGLLRFPDFYMRSHAATVGTIGGAVLPVFGAGFVALVYHPLGGQRFFMAGIAFTVGVLILLISPTGSHSLVSAVYFGKVGKKPRLVIDQLEEDLPKRSDVAELVREHETVPGEEEEPKFSFRRVGR